MGSEQVSFLAGKNPYGDSVWVPASVEDREQRGDGEWLYVLPAFSDSEDSARWVKASEVRMPKSNRAAEESAAHPTQTGHLRVVK
jgi:hypothetical protein